MADTLRDRLSRGWDRNYCRLSRWTGAALLAVAFCRMSSFIFFAVDHKLPPEMGFAVFTIVYSCLIPGALLLGFAEFLQYTASPDTRPSWIVRHLPHLLFTLAMLMLVYFACVVSVHSGHGPQVRAPKWSAEHIGWLLLTSLPIQAVPTIAQAIAYLVLAHALHRVLPVLGESKGLV